MSDLPEPLVPVDTDIKGLDGFLLDTDKLLASELWALSTGEEFKAAVGLWMRAWKQKPPGSLPDDDRVLASFSGAGARWKKVRDMALRGFVKCSDGRLYNTTLCADVLRAAGAKKARHAQTKAATEARQAKRDAERNVPPDDERNVPRNEVPWKGKESNTQDPIPTLNGLGDFPKGHPPLTPADAAVMADQGLIDFTLGALQSRDLLPFHAAQTYLSSRCKTHGTAAVVAVLRDVATLPVVSPRAVIEARLKEFTDGKHHSRRQTSAVDRVKAAAAERQRAAAAAGQDY